MTKATKGTRGKYRRKVASIIADQIAGPGFILAQCTVLRHR